MQEYDLFIPWETKDLIGKALETGDPRPIEKALRDYHDPVVAAGGVLYFFFPELQNSAKGKLAQAMIASVGDILASDQGTVSSDDDWIGLLKIKAAHPAFHNASTRRHIPTNADDKYYSFLRTSKDGSERILAVMNFQADRQTVAVDISGVRGEILEDLTTRRGLRAAEPFSSDVVGVRLPFLSP